MLVNKLQHARQVILGTKQDMKTCSKSINVFTSINLVMRTSIVALTCASTCFKNNKPAKSLNILIANKKKCNTLLQRQHSEFIHY